MSSILPLLNKLVPAGIAIKGIEKIDPRLKNFFSAAFTSGYGADQALDYLRSRMERSDERNRLESDNQRGTLRSDEKAGLQQIRAGESIKDLGKGAAALGAGAVGGLSALGALGSDVVNPSEITRSVHNQSPKQIGNSPQRLQIEEKPRPNVPQEGSVITPGISPNQMKDSKRISALQRFRDHQKKQSLVEQEYERFQRGYQDSLNKLRQEQEQILMESAQQQPEDNTPSNNSDEMLLAALQKILQM